MYIHIFMTEHKSSGVYLHYHNHGSEKEKVLSISYEILKDLLVVNYHRIFELFVLLKEQFSNTPDGIIVKTIYSVNLSKPLPFETVKEESIALLRQFIFDY